MSRVSRVPESLRDSLLDLGAELGKYVSGPWDGGEGKGLHATLDGYFSAADLRRVAAALEGVEARCQPWPAAAWPAPDQSGVADGHVRMLYENMQGEIVVQEYARPAAPAGGIA
jgi:hypothetical protein